jgi:phage gp36-like protein
MAYITVDDLKKAMPEAELIQLTDDEKAGSLTAAALARIAEAIAGAGADIEAYAGTRYATPLQTSEKVQDLACDLTIWRLEKRRRKIRENTQTAYDAAIAFLDKVAAGRAKLDQPVGAPAQSDAQQVRTTETEGPFSNDNLDRF